MECFLTAFFPECYHGSEIKSACACYTTFYTYIVTPFETEQGTTSVRKFARFCTSSACLLYVCCPCQSIGISRKMYKEKCFVCWSLPIYCNPQENTKGKTKKNYVPKTLGSSLVCFFFFFGCFGVFLGFFCFFFFFWGGFPMCHISPLSILSGP